jgi:hypothetical protein
MMQLPKHKASLTLTHNDHKDYYESVKQNIEREHPSYDKEDFISEEDMQKCIDTNELWKLQWYPDTPIGSYTVLGSTLEIVLQRALEIEKEY